jgi:UDP-GlcNAc:undecaprenyl-phosphate GlcNAc-1-phosphate transferase
MELSSLIPTSLLCPAVGALCAVFVWLMTFPVRTIALRKGVVARQNARRRHAREVPLLGGTPIYLALLALSVFSGSVDDSGSRTHWYFAAALTLIHAVGVLDDIRELKAPPKFLAQIAAACLVLFSDPKLPTLFQGTLPAWVAVPILLFWIVGVTNAMNMIDGLDGLCAGIGAISAITVSAIFFASGGQPGFEAVLIAGLAGACLGFLAHNFHPARIFLGDSGSLLIGFVLAVASVKLDVKRSLFVSLSMPIMLLGLPLIDVALSIIRRRILDRSMFSGDRSHLHHRLQQIGLSHRGAVLLLWMCAAYLGVAAFSLAQLPLAQSTYVYLLIVPTLTLWLTGLYFVEKRLSFQTARFSQLFLKQEYAKLGDRDRLVEYMRDQVAEHHKTGSTLTVVVLDCGHFMKELASERPHRMVAFYMDLYGILRARLRGTDLVARISDHRLVAILRNTSGTDGGDEPVINFLSEQTRLLQQNYGVFQADGERPEGFRVLRYPRDRAKVWDTLSLDHKTMERLHADLRPRDAA